MSINKTKFFLLLLFSFAYSLCSGPSHASGFYVGVGAGSTMAQHKMGTQMISVGGGANNISTDGRRYMKKTSFSGGIFAGYTYQMDIFSLGFEVGGLLHQGKAQKNSVITLGGAPATYGFQLSRTYTLQLLTKWGILLGNDFSANLLLGVVNSRFTLNYLDLEQGGAYNSNQKKTLWGFAPGAEMLYHVNPEWSLGVSYVYEVYQPFKSREFLEDVGPPSTNFQTKIHPTFHTIMGRVNYKF